MSMRSKIQGLVKLSSRSYRARPLRTFLTVFGMSIGMSAVLLLVSFGYGLQAELLKRITTADTLYTLTVTVPPLEEKNVTPITEETLNVFRESQSVAEVSSARITQGFARYNGVSSAVSIFSIGIEYPRLSGLKLVTGETLEEYGGENGVLVGMAIARTFNIEPEALLGVDLGLRSVRENDVGELTSGEEKQLTVIGIIDSPDNIVYVPKDEAKAFIDESLPYNEARVRAISEEAMERVRSELVDEGYDVSVIADIVRQVDTFFTIVQFILGFFGIIALIVSAVGMFNTMTVALLERTKEIGIMKSIGATDRYIAFLFIMEAFTMGVMGGVLGIIIAFAEMSVINTLVNFAASRMGGDTVDLFVSPLWFLMLILVFSGMVGMLTGFIPARKASRLDPLQALQYK